MGGGGGGGTVAFKLWRYILKMFRSCGHKVLITSDKSKQRKQNKHTWEDQHN